MNDQPLQIKVYIEKNLPNVNTSSYVCDAFWKTVRRDDSGNMAANISTLFLQHTSDIAKKIVENKSTRREEEVVVKLLFALDAIAIETCESKALDNEGSSTPRVTVSALTAEQIKTDREQQDTGSSIDRAEVSTSNLNILGDKERKEMGSDYSASSSEHDNYDAAMLDDIDEDTDEDDLNLCEKIQRSQFEGVEKIGTGVKNAESLDFETSVNVGDCANILHGLREDKYCETRTHTQISVYRKARQGHGPSSTHTVPNEKDDDKTCMTLARKRLYVPAGLRCDFCLRVFKWRHNLKSHMKKAHDGTAKMHLCPKCPKVFDRINSLQLHCKKVHSEKGAAEQTWKCDLCKKFFFSLAGLKRHQKIMHMSQRKSHVCYVCGLELKWKHNLTAHIRTVHDKIKKVMCDQCGKTFCSAYALKNHILHKHDLGKKGLLDSAVRHTCEICAKSYTSKFLLKRHAEFHTNENQCKICKRRFVWQRNLKTHIAEVHNKIKPCVCKVCGKTFRRKNELKNHVQYLHEGIVSGLVCIICTKVMTTKAGLYSHMERHKQNILQCNCCQKTFRIKADLQRHKLIQTGTGWRCKQCGNQFASQKLRDNHVCKVNGNEGVIDKGVATAESQ